jgi:hypothetical protein
VAVGRSPSLDSLDYVPNPGSFSRNPYFRLG